jgi:hypothetical protein
MGNFKPKDTLLKQIEFAPIIDPNYLWNLSPDEFNQWRREYDFPRIIKYCKLKLNKFKEWQRYFDISDDDMLLFGPGIFLKPEREWFIAIHTNSNNETRYHFHKQCPRLKSTWGGEIITCIYKRFIPYLTWAEKKLIPIHEKNRSNDIVITTKSGSLKSPHKNSRISAKIFNEIEVLFLGNCTIEGIFLGGRMLEFTCLDGLYIKECSCNQSLRIWFSSAEYLNVNSHLAFVEFFSTQVNHINIINSTLQDWQFEKSVMYWGEITNSTLFKWKVKCIFTPLFNNVKLDDCDFRFNSESYYLLKQIRENYNFISRAYSSIGRYREAGKYYYLEEITHLKQLSNPLRYNNVIPGDRIKSIIVDYRKGIFTKKESLKRFQITLKNYFKFFINPLNWVKSTISVFKLIFSFIEYIFWGYGEKPLRTIGFSAIIVLLFSLFYYVFNSFTYHNIIQSIYLSASAFLSFGFTELSNSDMYAGIVIEAFLGVLCTGFLIVGLSNKRKY